MVSAFEDQAELLERLSTTERLANRNDQLVRLASELSGEQTRFDAATRVMAIVLETHHPYRAALFEVDEAAGVLRMLVGASNGVIGPVEGSPWQAVPLSMPSGLSDAVTRQSTIAHGDPDTLLADYPHLAGRIEPDQKAWVAVPMVSGRRVVGVLGLTYEAPQSFDSDDLSHLEALARLGAVNFERIGLHQRLQDALTESRAAQSRQAVLAEAGRILATPLDPHEIADEFTRLCVPTLATGCFVDQMDEQGLRLLSLCHVDSASRDMFLAARDSAFPGGLIPKMHPLLSFIEAHESWSYHQDAASSGFDSVLQMRPELVQISESLGFHSVHFVSLRARGRTIGLLVVGRGEPLRPFDAEERKLIADLAARVALALDSAQLVRGLAAADESKDVFLAKLAHELRNPVGAISLAASALGRRHRDDKHVAIINRQVAHLSRLLRDLMDLSRITQDKIDLELDAVVMNEVVREVVSRHPAVQKEGREIRLQICAEPLLVRADAVRMTQVLNNILDNAVKFSPEDTPIAVKLWGEGEDVALSIRDYGRGLTPDEQVAIFRPFAQFAPNKKGLGLGLAIVQQIVSLHEGTIKVESEGAGEGTCFTIRFAQLREFGTTLHDASLGGVEHGESWRILLVEDEDDARHVLAATLEDWGHQVRTAGTAEGALAIARTEGFDVAVIDIGLPDMTGIELAPLLVRQWGAGPRLLAISGYGQSHDIARAFAAGFDEYFIKPLDTTRLREYLATQKPRNALEPA